MDYKKRVREELRADVVEEKRKLQERKRRLDEREKEIRWMETEKQGEMDWGRFS